MANDCGIESNLKKFISAVIGRVLLGCQAAQAAMSRVQAETGGWGLWDKASSRQS